jgi:hypothetical protein
MEDKIIDTKPGQTNHTYGESGVYESKYNLHKLFTFDITDELLIETFDNTPISVYFKYWNL